ncbi:MAG: SPOR domain-containing protein [Deltaproteobacteria bacterium]|nr:SPOR domain-containing protein [Deltaproteobacteria bacterium]
MATREAELYKDKIEVSLDGRQIFYLFFGGAVLVGMVFVLGVMVGRRVESRSHVDRLDHGRAASDPLAALDTLESRKLSFQDALTKSEPTTQVERQIDDLAKARGLDPKPSAKPVEAKLVEAKPAEAKPAVEAKPVEAKPERLEKDRKDKKDKKATEPKSDIKEPVTKPEQAMVDKPAQVSRAKKPVAEERVNADVITVLDPPKKPEPAGEPDKAKPRFTLQLSSFQDKQEAETFLSSVKAAGYQAYVTEAEVSGKGTFYRVRVGKYGSLDAANNAKADVEKATRKSASVMRL